MRISIRELTVFHKTPLGTKNFTPRINLAIAINKARTKTILDGFYKSFNTLIDESVEKDDDGKWVKHDDGGYKLKEPNSFHDMYEELLDEEVEIDIKTVNEEEI